MSRFSLTVPRPGSVRLTVFAVVFLLLPSVGFGDVGAADDDQEPPDLRALYDDHHGAVVDVASAGHMSSGFLVSDRLIVAPDWVVDSGREVIVHLPDEPEPLRVEVVAIDDELGVSVLMLATPVAIEPLSFAKDSAYIGQEVTLLRSFADIEEDARQVAPGLVTSVRKAGKLSIAIDDYSYSDWLWSPTAGAPLLNRDGEVVAMARWQGFSGLDAVSGHELEGVIQSRDPDLEFDGGLEFVVAPLTSGLTIDGFGDGARIFSTIGVSLGLRAWDRWSTELRISAMMGGPLAKSADASVLAEFTGGGLFELDTGWHILLTDPASLAPVYLDVAIGGALQLVSTSVRRLENDEVVDIAGDLEVDAYPTLRLGLHALDFMETGIIVRPDVVELEDTQLTWFFGIKF